MEILIYVKTFPSKLRLIIKTPQSHYCSFQISESSGPSNHTLHRTSLCLSHDWLLHVHPPILSTVPSPITENHRPQSSPRVSPLTRHLWSQTTLTLTQRSPVTNLIAHTIPHSQINPTPIPYSFPKSDFINLQSLTLTDLSPHYQSNRLITALICFLTCSSVIRSLNAGQGLTPDRCHIHIGELSWFLSGWAKSGASEPTLFRYSVRSGFAHLASLAALFRRQYGRSQALGLNGSRHVESSGSSVHLEEFFLFRASNWDVPPAARRGKVMERILQTSKVQTLLRDFTEALGKKF